MRRRRELTLRVSTAETTGRPSIEVPRSDRPRPESGIRIVGSPLVRSDEEDE